MGERQVARLPFGSGLDRATGVMAVEPTAFADLRNVVLYNGKAQARRGMLSKSTLSTTTDVIALAPFRAQGKLIAVSWDSATRQVAIHALAGTGTAPVLVGNWFVAATQVGRPVVIIAESYGRLFFAHDFADTGLRATTYYYDPADTVTPLKPLQADLDRDGTTADIKFRGVQTYLSYLIGWGFGTDSDADRPEIARVSMPGDPLTFVPEHLFYAGQRASPILAGWPAGNTFLLLKETESYEITGYDRTTFAIRPADPLYGAVAHRLCVTVGGILYFWSLEGPRMTTGGRSTDIAVPLDLAGPSPSDLAAEGDVTLGFAYYLPFDRCVCWAFPTDGTNKTREYCLSLRDEGDRRWSYWERGVRILCAGTVHTSTAGFAPPGAPTYNAASGITHNKVRYNWTNAANAIGDETVEIWAAAGAGTYVLRGTVTLNTPGAAQYFDEPLNLDPSTTYNVALRYKRGSLYNAGAENAGAPGSWPVGSRGSFTTTAAPVYPNPNFRLTACSRDASYVTRTVAWDNPAPIYGWEIFESSGSSSSTVPDFGSAVLRASGPDYPGTYNLSTVRQYAEPFTFYRWFFRFVGDVTVYELDLGSTILNNEGCETSPPVGRPDYGLIAAQGEGYTDIQVNHNTPAADEQLQSAIRESPAGSWLITERPVITGASQIVSFGGLSYNTNYDVAFRYRGGAYYNAGAENSADPSTWPALSQGGFTQPGP